MEIKLCLVLASALGSVVALDGACGFKEARHKIGSGKVET